MMQILCPQFFLGFAMGAAIIAVPVSIALRASVAYNQAEIVKTRTALRMRELAVEAQKSLASIATGKPVSQ